MERLNVIVCGLGSFFFDNQEWVIKKYNVIGYADKVRNDMYYPFYEYNELFKLKDVMFLVTSTKYGAEIINTLLDCRVKQQSMIFLQNEINRLNCKITDYFTSYAQFGEDYVICSLLKKRGKKLGNVKYLEVGVDYPLTDSNTYLLDMHGADGVLVEANPEMIPIIQICRSSCKVLNRLVVDSNGDYPETMTFNIADISAVSSIFAEEVKNHEGSIKKSIQVNTVRLEELFAEYGSVDVLSLDMEGMDNKVLMSVDWERYHPDIICAETRKPSLELIRYMNKKSYELYYFNEVNTIWFAT